MSIDTIYCGIDPGKKGGIVFLFDYGKQAAVYTMPLIANELDIKALYKRLESPDNNNVVYIVEDVHAIFGSAAKATFTFGYIVGVIRALLVSLNCRFTLVTPKTWQKEMHQGIPDIRKPSIKIKKGKRTGQTIKGRRDTKAMSLLAAQRLFPNVNLCANERCRKPHDGIVDALLLAEWGRRRRL